MAEYIEREAVVARLQEHRRLFTDAWGDFCSMPLHDKARVDELSNCIAEIFNAPAADVAPVVHGRWVHTKKHLWYKDENGNIDTWRVDVGFHNGPQCRVCGESFCVHCNPGWEDEECEIGHYLCSECAETSKDAHESYCPNCGARMDGDSNE